MPDSATESIPKSDAILRVLHTADWHLGKMLGDLDRTQEHRRFLDWLQSVITRERVDVLLIAGDIFDTANPPQSAERMYFEFLANIYRQTTCAVVITGGNHDSPAHLEAPSRVLRTLNVHVTGALPESMEDLVVSLPSVEHPQLVVAAVPFLRDRDLRTSAFGQTADAIKEELREGIERVYQSAAQACLSRHKEGAALLAMGHLTVAGARVSESERAVHVGGLGKIDHKIFPSEFAYVALGHLHRPQAMDSEAIRYSGSPIPLSFSECDDIKEVRVLDFESGDLVANKELVIPPARYLARLKTTRSELESALAEFAPPKGALPSWVEVSVETTDGSENLFEFVRSLTEARRDDFEVIRVQARRERTSAMLSESDAAGFEDVDSLLDDPREVFDLRLELEDDLTCAESDEARTAFRELYQVYLDQEGLNVPDPPQEAESEPPGRVPVPVAAEELLFDFGDGENAR